MPNKPHDLGGQPNHDPINQPDHPLADWERRIDAIRAVLGDHGHITVDELRRAIENLPPQRYHTLTYYQRWTEAVETLLIEKNLITAAELDTLMARQDTPGGGP